MQRSVFAAFPPSNCQNTQRIYETTASSDAHLMIYGAMSVVLAELDWGNGKNVSPGRERAIASRMTSIRQVVVYLFLADGSLEISETRQVHQNA